MNELSEFKFMYKDKEYDLYKIVGSEGIYEGTDFGKPIIVKGGIAALCKKFGFVDEDYAIKWHDFGNTTIKVRSDNGAYRDEGLGTGCSIVITMLNGEGKKIIGDGEANAVNCKGIAGAHMQAMAIKRARSRAILQELGIDAYGEEESQDFEKKIPGQKATKKFLADAIIALAANLDTPLERPALQDLIRSHFGLGPSDRLNMDTLESKGLLMFYRKLYARHLNSTKVKNNDDK